MTWTSLDLANIDAAIAKGATSFQHDGRKVEYRSLDEMLRVRAMIANEVAGITPDGSIAVYYPSVSKGLC